MNPEEDTFDLSTNKVRSYAFEPLVNTDQQSSTEENTGKHKLAYGLLGRSGTTSWCTCGRCKIMESEEESKCCKESDEIPEDYGGKVCIAEIENFKLSG